MKKLYVFPSIYNFTLTTFFVDSLITDVKNGFDVTALVCDKCLNTCQNNILSLSVICHNCYNTSIRILRNIKGVKILKYSDCIENCKKYKNHQYNTLEELKSIEYKGINIGYGVLSYYVSKTRNLNPFIDSKLKFYLDKFIISSMKTTDVAFEILSDSYDEIYLVNGRMFNTKPFQEVALLKGIKLIIVESGHDTKGKYVKKYYYNTKVHSIEGRTNYAFKMWNDSSLPEDKKKEYAISFFEKRFRSEQTNDKIYTKKQKKGEIPEFWDESKYNIVIFNSSEDELYAIGDEFEKGKLFKNQYEGLEYLFSQIKDDNIHFYLRIHPNLKNIKYKYCTQLKDFSVKYKNVTVIPGDSSISTYSLMEKADKIITFGSTMGVESSYWGKVVVNLNPCFYNRLKIGYHPSTKEEAISLILEKSLKPINDDVFKYAYMYYNDEGKSCINEECKLGKYTLPFIHKKVYSMNYFCSDIQMKFLLFLLFAKELLSKYFLPQKEA